MSAVETIKVALGDRGYPIHAGHDLGREVKAEVARLRESGRKPALLTDASVLAAQSSWIEDVFAGVPRHVVPAGEPSKSFSRLEAACRFLADAGLDRKGAVFALGGGVVGDLAGCAAGVYLRGIDFYQIPTTLLAMVDSSVGGKTGINLPEGKNLVGVFHQPQAVYLQSGMLATLPARHFSAGMGEVIKHGLLGKESLFRELEERVVYQPVDTDLPALLLANCRIKANVVEADEKEAAGKGGRALLNLGHTFGHAIEAVAGYGEYLHGEAVAVGLNCAARLSRDLGLIGETEVERIASVLVKYDLPIRLRAPLDPAALLAAMGHDKKNRAGRRRYVVLEAIGQAATREEIPLERIESIWREVM